MERLQKVIAHAGVASRRKAEQLIVANKVTVNGKVVACLGTKVKRGDRIEVNGIPLEQEKLSYYLLYKPRRVVSTVSDDKDRRTVCDFFPEVKERLYPVGRLDYDTSGLIIMTNDGELAHRLMHPSFNIKKTYIVKIASLLSAELLGKLEQGIVVDGCKTAPAKVKILAKDNKKKTMLLSLVIHEGKNRQIRKMFAALKVQVLKLRRDRYAFLTLDGLIAGQFRPLQQEEVKKLYKLTERL